jgi:hypothetical protein
MITKSAKPIAHQAMLSVSAPIGFAAANRAKPRLPNCRQSYSGFLSASRGGCGSAPNEPRQPGRRLALRCCADWD